MTALELDLMSPEYGMTFARHIRGEAKWPTSTRLGHHTQVRLSQMETSNLSVERLRRRRNLRALLLWLPRLPLRVLRKLVFALRRDFSVYAKVGRRDGWRVARGKPTTTGGPAEKPSRIREKVMPALYEPVSEQQWPTRIVSWLLYRRHSELDGSACGLRDWTVTDPPMTPDYMTPNPVSGYVPSKEYRLRFRPHEFESEYRYPESEATARRWYVRAAETVRVWSAGGPQPDAFGAAVLRIDSRMVR